MSVQPIFDVCGVESHGRCNRVMIEQVRLISDQTIYPGWWHLQWRGPDLWRMWDREGDLPPQDATEFTIETPSQDKHELEQYLGEAVWQSLRDADLLGPDLP